MYRNRARSDNPPHVFAMADAAYHAMLHQRRSQCIVISGESGAGSFKENYSCFLLSCFLHD
jgi:myosin-3